MGWPVIDQIRGWVGKRQKLFKGLLGVVVEEAVQCIPGVGLAIKVVGEIAKHGVERLSDANQEVPDLKPAGQPFPVEQLDQINAWLQTLTTAYQGLLDKLDTGLTLPAHATDPEVCRLLKDALSRHDDLAGAFAAQQIEVRRQTLSLTLVEQQLDAVLHGQHQLAASLEDLKTAFIQSPLWSDWQQLRKARPEAVAAVIQADELFLAGQRDQGGCAPSTPQTARRRHRHHRPPPGPGVFVARQDRSRPALLRRGLQIGGRRQDHDAGPGAHCHPAQHRE